MTLEEFEKKYVELFETRKPALPAGFHPLSSFYGGEQNVVTVPWGASRRVLVLQTPGAGVTCGIQQFIDVENNKPKVEDAAEFVNWAEKVVKAAMYAPSYEEYEELKCRELPKFAEGLAAHRRMEAKYKNLAKTKKCELKDVGQFVDAERWEHFVQNSQVYGCILPYNAIMAITLWAQGSAVTDAKLVDEDMLENCYMMAKHYGKAPHEHCPLALLSGSENEFDAKALMVYNKRHPQKKGKK